MEESVLDSLISHYEDININDVSSGRSRLCVRHITPEEAHSLINASAALFSKESIVVRISPPCVIIGDIHGSLLDLVRIVQRCGRPSPHNKYLFLGDIIDNGPLSLDTVVLLLALKVSFPESVFILRGDHEFPHVTPKANTFESSILDAYGSSDLVDRFFKLFEALPLAAVVDDTILCVHGGIGPHFTSLLTLSQLQKPVSYRDNKIFEDIIWSDPQTSQFEFTTNRSRGCGSFFNSKAVAKFMDANHISMIVRGHELRKRGVEMEFEGTVVTVFSSSNYMGYDNMCGVLYIRSRSEYEARRYEPLNCPCHIDAVSDQGNVRHIMKRKHELVKRTSSDYISSLKKRSLLGQLAMSPRKQRKSTYA